ncbi:MAG: BamA/TamA family outer membrane protein [Thermoanaerobaculia bacterium]
MNDIFNHDKPGENGFFYRLVDQLHRNTRSTVVEELLLFRSGDRYDPRVLAESERLLRHQRIFYDASIRPTRYCGNQVDVEVAVRDVWTLFLNVSFGRAGGANKTRFELQDANLLGTGKDVALARTSDFDRTSLLASYEDKALFGSRTQLQAAYSDNSDGSSQLFDLEHPFFGLDTRWALGLSAHSDDRITRLFTLGKSTDRFRQKQDGLEGFMGFSKGLKQGHALRLMLGATYLEDRFSAEDPFSPPPRLPEDRRLIYPWVGFEWLEDRFVKTHNLDKLVRTEDLYLGRRLTGRLGYSASALGADRNRAIFALHGQQGAEVGKSGVLLLAGDASGRYGSDLEDTVIETDIRYFRRDFGSQLLTATASMAWGRSLDLDHQLLLGGDNGLRGYPLRFQHGDRRALFSIEQRFFTNWDFLHLIHVGAAVFADIGRAWADEDPHANPGVNRVLKDVGFGLRLGSSRSARGSLVHIDVAFPLDGNRSIDQLQFLVMTKETF